jgi:hypothetical protein
MPRGDCSFRKRDLKVAIEAAREAGEKGLVRVRIGEMVLESLPEGACQSLASGIEAEAQGDANKPPAEAEPPWKTFLKAKGYKPE